MITFKMAHAHNKLMNRRSCRRESNSILATAERETRKGEFRDVHIGLYRVQCIESGDQELPDLNRFSFEIGWALWL
jgi:hypothetical protein